MTKPKCWGKSDQYDQNGEKGLCPKCHYFKSCTEKVAPGFCSFVKELYEEKDYDTLFRLEWLFSGSDEPYPQWATKTWSQSKVE